MFFTTEHQAAEMLTFKTFDQAENTAVSDGTKMFFRLLLGVSVVTLSTCHVDAQVVKETAPTGLYSLVTVDGSKLPTTISHGNVEVEVRSGTFTINTDGTCNSRTIFGPPSEKDVTREVSATFAQNGSTLTMQWKGAGRTSGTIKGDSFTMDNEGTIFSYKRQPGNEVLDRFVGTWRSVQTEGSNAGDEDTVDLTYSRRLGGSFVQELGKVSDRDTAMIMYTYDSDQNVFRLWRFAANDPPSQATGTWDAESQALEWTYAANAKQNFTMTARHRFLDDNAFEWHVVGKDSADKVLFRVKGRATRTGGSTK